MGWPLTRMAILARFGQTCTQHSHMVEQCRQRPASCVAQSYTWSTPCLAMQLSSLTAAFSGTA